MRTEELVRALRRMKVETGSLVCAGCGHEHNCGIHGCAVIREAADRLEWVPVTERLPEPETRVLVLERYGHMMDRTMRQLPTDKTPVFRPDGLMPGKDVTHWMPLPEAPEVE